MIDLVLFERILSTEKKFYIDHADVLDRSVLKFLADRRWRQTDVLNLLACGDGTWRVEIRCECCGAWFWTDFTKTRLALLLKDMQEGKKPLVWCPACAETKKAEKASDARTQEERWAALRLKKTAAFISIYLSPDSVWHVPQKRWFYALIEDICHCDKEAIASHIQQMDYAVFLATPYWKGVASRVRQQARFSCSLCSEKERSLEVHHRTYEHHGYEHMHLEDLICLCDLCHSKFHDKFPEAVAQYRSS